MALAKQFYSSFKSYNGWEYYLEIWVESYSGSASEISLGVSGPVITYGTDQQDRFSPILSSKLELPFMVTNATEDAFIKNIREQFNERDVYIHLYRANSSDYSSVAPLWSGYVLMDLSASPDLYYPYPVTLTAIDGLALLKEIDFVQSGTAGSYSDSDMYSSNGRFTYWIKEILLKTGASTTTEGSTQDYKFTTAINWFNSVMPTITQSTDPFYQTKCGTKMFFSKDANGNFTVVNSYDVLLNLLKHWGARIIYWKHIFYIVQIQEYNTAESGTYANPDNINTRTYTKTGAFDSSSDNLGDSYWTRYNLLIDDVTGGIQKLTGTQFNYLPQLKRTQANFLDYGNKNYFGGIPFDITTGQTDVILQSTFEDVSSDGAMLLMIPLDVTIVQQYNGSLDLRIFFRLYITDGATTYYLRYNPTNTPKFYWESSTTVNLNNNQTKWYSTLDNIVGTQTKVGFHQLIEFKDSGGSSLNLSGEWKAYIDIDSWGNIAGSFYFYASLGGLNQNNVQVFQPSLTTVYYTNTLNPNYQTPLNPVVLGTTNQQTTGLSGTQFNYTTNNIISYQTSLNINPFEGKFLIVNTNASGAIYGSQVMVTPQTITNDVEVVDFGDLIWGDTLLASSEGSLKVWNGSSFVKSNVTGTWGLGSTSGTNSFTEMLLSEYLFGQTKVVESPSMQLVIGETNKNQNDGSGLRPNYVNPIGRLKGYSATGTTPYYIFKSGSFHLLRDEIDYEGYQIIRNSETVTKTDDIIIGPDILQDKTNKIGQKTPVSNTLSAKLTQNSYITTISSTKKAYGNDVAVNGIFSSDSSWSKGTGWSIASNKASFSPTGSTSQIKQDILTNALIYKITLSVSVSAGGLSVKAGSTGSATVLSASGTYEIFSTCSGSTDVIFEASAAFEGYIEKVVVQQQVPVTSISINAIQTAVFKTNDVLNIANFDGNEINEFTVSSDQGASDTSISVTSKLITEDILEGSIILINQNDLAAQYQNKTKGTVGGFDITSNSIDSGSVSIESYIDDDTFATASATSLATSESIKAYVDTQVGSADTLAEVLANGNTTGGSDIVVNDNDKINFGAGNDLQIYHDSNNSYIKDEGTGDLYIQGSDDIYITAANGEKFITCNTNDSVEIRYDNSIKLATTNTGISITGGGVFTGQVTIPATPVASTDAASKGYVDSQVETVDTLEEVTANGNSTSYGIEFTSTNFSVGQAKIGLLSSNNIVYLRGGSGGLMLQNGSGSGAHSIQSSGIHIFEVGSSEKMRLNSTGLGIGTSSPEEILHIQKTDNDARIQIITSNTRSSTIFFGDTDDDNAGIIEYDNNGDFMRFFANASERMRIDSSGRLLLNATSTSFNDKFYINNDAYTTGGWRVGTSATYVGKMYNNAGKLTIESDGDRDIQFQSGNNAGIMYIDTSTQRIGINNTSPSYKLDVNGTFRVSSSSVFSSQITAGYGVKFTNGDTDFLLYNNSGEDVLYMRDTTNGAMITTWGVNNFTVNKDLNLQLSATTQRALSSTGTDSIQIGDAGVNDIRFKNAVGSVARFLANGNVLIGGTTDSGARLYVNGVIRAVGGGIQAAQDYGFTLNDEAGNNRYGLKFGAAGTVGGSDLLMLTNRSIYSAATSGGIVTIGGNSSTTGVSEVEIARFDPRVTATSGTQKKVTLDAVLELTEQTAPADPASGESIIWMDSSSGDLKVKINYGGTTVTRTLASFE